MTNRKKTDKSINESSTDDIGGLKTSHPLVFISHDTRDAELAEEFSNLLKSASAGALKSFRSSDKKGTQGIEYGLEWYPAIMDKIDEASEVVCLLTQRSVDRPWILYEAGVAKGKLGKKVIGIALGITHSVAFTGPFAQFQNNDGSIGSITKLVLDLVCKVPGLDPDKSLVEQLVTNFHQKVTVILEKGQKQPETTVQETSGNLVAKLFEEIKIMFDSLPSRIENKVDPEYKKRRRKFHPMMLEDIIHMWSKFEDPSVSFLMINSFFRDEYPWLYEIGMETYRGVKAAKSESEKEKLIKNFDRAYEMFGHPLMIELWGESEEMYLIHNEMRHFMRRFLKDFYIDKKSKE